MDYKKASEKPKDVYRWFLVGALTIIMMGFYGAYLSFGVLLKPVLGEFGWTRTTISGAMSTAAGISGLLGILSGRLTDKYGATLLIYAGAFLGVLGYLLLIWMHSVWQLYVYFGIIIGISFSVCWTPVTATVSKFFSGKRVLALGITTSGITLGHMFIPPLVAVFINAEGWRFAYAMLALIIFMSAIPAVVILRKNSPKAMEMEKKYQIKQNKNVDKAIDSGKQQKWTVSEAIKTLSFWILMATGFVTAAGFFFIAVHIVAYATDMGIDPKAAAFILTFMGGANILGKLLSPSIVVKIGSKLTLLILLALQALALFMLMWAHSLWVLFLLGSIFGFGFGASSPLRMSMISDFFGVQSIGTMIGIIEIAWSLGAISGPVMAGYVFDISGSYNVAFLTGGLIVLTGMVATYFLKKPLVLGDAQI